jgi:hypothetical protein
VELRIEVEGGVRVHDMQHSKQQIREAAASVTADVHCRVRQDMEFQLEVCRTNGAHLKIS